MKNKILLVVLLVATALREAWVWAHEAGPAESYFRMCSQRLAPGFFDGPAGTALLVRAFGDSFGSARLFWPVLALLCSWAAWIFIRRIYEANTAARGVLLLNALPVFNRAAVEVGPLMPALISVLTGLIFARLAWNGRRWAWVGAGVFFAAGILFRYEVVLMPAGLLAAALAVRRHRADIPGLAVVVLLCGLALWPPLAWNASLEWVPIAGGTWKSAWTFRAGPFLAGLAELCRAFSIPVLLMVFVGAGFFVRRARLRARAGFLLAASGLAWVWCVYLLLRGGDAVAAAWLGFVPPAAFLASSSIKWRRGRAAWAAVIVLALGTGGYSLAGARDPSWKAVAAELLAAARALPAAGQGGFFIAEDPGLAAVLGCQIRADSGYPAVFVPESPDISSQFALWPSYADFVDSSRVSDEYFTEQKGENSFIGRDAVYIGHELPQTIKGAFTNVSPLKKIPGPHGRELILYLCIGYQTLPL
ncbi:MAG: glycosyltransferase family 39 protein [Verrucomicrobiae bacterium]